MKDLTEQFTNISCPEGHHEECPLSSKNFLIKEDMDDCECPEDENKELNKMEFEFENRICEGQE